MADIQKETDINYYFKEYMQKKYFDVEGDMLNVDEFCKVQFKYGYPVIYRKILYVLIGYCFGFEG